MPFTVWRLPSQACLRLDPLLHDDVVSSVEEPLEIAEERPTGDDIREVLERHLAFAHEVTPADHVHALDADGLTDPAVTFFAARRGRMIVGVGAIRELASDHAELKSMHTVEAVRGQGVGRAVLEHLLAVARARGYTRVSLETGTMSAFAAARSMYRSAGFEPCEPYGAYTENPHSVCMSMEL